MPGVRTKQGKRVRIFEFLVKTAPPNEDPEPGAGTIYMSVDVFLDTNILVYAVTSDEGEKTKRKRALDIIER